MIIKKDLVLFEDDSKSQEELFNKAEEILLKKEIVKRGFSQALLEREREYPTGLGINGLNIALSHTSADFSLDNELMLINLQDPINFTCMETGDDIPVQHVFILVLKSGTNHLKILQSLARVMQDKLWIEKVKNSKSKDELLEVINESLNIEKEV